METRTTIKKGHRKANQMPLHKLLGLLLLDGLLCGQSLLQLGDLDP